MATKQAKGQKIGRGSRSNSSKQQKTRSDRNKNKAIAAELKTGNKLAGVAMTSDQYKPNHAKLANRAEVHAKADLKLVTAIRESAKHTRPSVL